MGTTERQRVLYADMDELFDLLTLIMTGPQINAWFHMNNPLLGGNAAVDLIKQGKTEEVFVAAHTLVEAADARFTGKSATPETSAT